MLRKLSQNKNLTTGFCDCLVFMVTQMVKFLDSVVVQHTINTEWNKCIFFSLLCFSVKIMPTLAILTVCFFSFLGCNFC